MTEQDIIKWGEIQYLTGRLDEIFYQEIPSTLDLHESRLLDVRETKYLEKLKAIDEVAYLSYLTHRTTRYHDKKRGQREIKSLLEEILETSTDPAIIGKIKSQISKYAL